MESMARLLDWSLIRSFIALIDTGNLQAAARRVNSSQPTVGRHIALLEQQIGKRLFDRRARQLIPTETALLIAQYARNMENNAFAIDRVLKGIPATTPKKITITTPQGVAWGYLPAILPSLHACYPEVLFSVCASNRVMNLSRGEADIAIRMFRPEQDALIVRRVGHIKLGIYAHKNYAKRRMLPQSVEDLVQHHLISFDTRYAKTKFCQLLNCKEDELVVRFQSDDFYVQVQMLMQGLGLMLMPDSFACTDGNLVRCLPGVEIDPLDVWLIMHEDLRTCPITSDIYQTLANSLEKTLQADVKVYLKALSWSGGVAAPEMAAAFLDG